MSRRTVTLIIIIAVIIGGISGIFLIDLKQKEDARKRLVDSFSVENLRKRDFPEQELRTEKALGDNGSFKSFIVSYTSDGLKQFALMCVPDGKAPAKGFPVIVVNHGHIPPDKYSTVSSYVLVTSFYASKGFLVLKPDYRGHDRSQESGNNTFDRFNYTADVMYLLKAVPAIREADRDNVFLFGHSMGGDITLKLLEISGIARAASLWAPVSVPYPESLLYFMRKHPGGERPVANIMRSFFRDEDYPKISAASNLKYISVPVLLQHGTMDESVPYEWSVKLSQKMKDLGKDLTFVTYDGEDHNFAKGSFYKALQRDVDFFRAHIK